MIETTIQKQHGFDNKEIINAVMVSLGLKTLLIAREDKNEVHDTHFHVLCDNEVDQIDRIYQQSGLIFREVRDLEATITYFTKEGKYQTYNGFKVNLSKKNKLDMKQVIEDIENGSTYADLVYKYGYQIVKNCYGIQHLIRELNKNKRKERS